MLTERIFEELTVKQQELSTRIQVITNDFQKGRSADFAEQTTECENDQVLQVIRDEAKEELNQINHALQRIKDDEYGFCVTCGEAIAEPRLVALPYTDFCINCAK